MLRTFAARNNKKGFEVWQRIVNIAERMSISTRMSTIMSTSIMSMIMNTSIIMSTICVRSSVSSS